MGVLAIIKSPVCLSHVQDRIGQDIAKGEEWMSVAKNNKNSIIVVIDVVHYCSRCIASRSTFFFSMRNMTASSSCISLSTLLLDLLRCKIS
jgi:predicted class III extradiol MEMO1 family dioxygenase